MRRLAACLLVMSAAFAGCLDGDGGDAGTSQASNVPAQPVESPDPGVSPGSDRTGGVPPSLEPGTAFAYEVSGSTAGADAVEVVVASAEGGGLILAAGTEHGLVGEVLHDRAWLGPVDASLNPSDSGTGGPVLFDWPLTDGKTWAFDEQAGLEVTANRTQVPAPGGQARGFVISGEAGSLAVTYTYAPSPGYLTTYTVSRGEQVRQSLRLTEVSTADDAVWFEEGPGARACSDWPPDSVQRFDVPAGTDAVVAGSFATGPGISVLQPPPAAGEGPHAQRHGEEARWAYEVVPGAEGTWTLSAQGRTPARAGGPMVCLTAVGVTWTSPGGPG